MLTVVEIVVSGMVTMVVMAMAMLVRGVRDSPVMYLAGHELSSWSRSHGLVL